MKDFIEQQIIDAVWKLLLGKVNDLLGDMDFSIPVIESGKCVAGALPAKTAIVPLIALTSSERTEKERIIRLDAYSLTITFVLPETPESELHCYAYSAVVCKALQENPTLGGAVDKVTVSGKKYLPPKKANCGQEWEAVISLRVTVENLHPCRFSP
jgi:hypothetical protein